MKKIVVIGPESTGKSTLCAQLAAHYSTLWCPEYAREYLLQHGTQYSFNDLLTIAQGQLRLEEEYSVRVRAAAAPATDAATDSPLATHHSPSAGPVSSLLFIDTDMYVMKVWCEFVFDNCHRYILDAIVERRYDLYLLCNVDLPWVKDELREYPDLETRNRLYHIYKDIIINQPVPWVDISGNYEERLKKAITAVDRLLGK